MTYDLYIGDYSYSSWSLRAWLLLHRYGLPMRVRHVDFAKTDVAAQLPGLAPARTVPTLVDADGIVLSDSIAIAEELATRHPTAGLWPTDPAARSLARNLTAEMHAGFSALRNECPMNLRTAYRNVPISDAVQSDLDRLQMLWSLAFSRYGGRGPWLFGSYTIADAFFAPVAARIAGYGLPVGKPGQTYVAAHLADPAFRRWRAMGLAKGSRLPWYDRDFTTIPWPGPKVRPAIAVDNGPAQNATCPYSGKPVSHFLETGGAVYGFCNAVCRDKTVADPDAWPAFAALLPS